MPFLTRNYLNSLRFQSLKKEANKMMRWSGWVAAAGGTIALVGNYMSGSFGEWAIPLGAVTAVVFGIWAAYE